ncbi:hypothetical protein EOD39_21592 [Acipenser ruthenus]|uniref:CCHC-type domain-containing protein n=1 Tax=Acipenser ruthenus TaxID=7906 RepID=A0A444USA0_ACIRT|nr:hypothetical protein EOD39_21592 [Acipenser ruthenus]
MGRKSCRKQQKRQQQQQLPPGDVCPSYAIDEWCPGCGEFGHTVAICPTQYQGEEWAPKRELQAVATKRESSWDSIIRAIMQDCWCPICSEQGHSPLNCPLLSEGCLLRPFPPAEGECLLVPPPSPPMKGGARASSTQKGGARASGAQKGEREHPVPRRGEREHPAPRRGRPTGPEPEPPAAEKEYLLPPPPVAEQRELSLPPPPPPLPPAEGESLLVPPQLPWEDCLPLPPPPAEGEYLLVLSPPPWENSLPLPAPPAD